MAKLFWLQCILVFLIVIPFLGVLAEDWVVTWEDEFENPDLSIYWNYESGCGGM